MKRKVYLAAPLFNPMERQFNAQLAQILGRAFEVFLPQRDGLLVVDLLNKGMDIEQAKRIVFERDVDALHSCDVVMAVLDGRSIDEGVAVELGMAYILGKECWGLKTDFRRLSFFGDNPMVEVIIQRRFHSIEDVDVAVEAERVRHQHDQEQAG